METLNASALWQSDQTEYIRNAGTEIYIQDNMQPSSGHPSGYVGNYADPDTFTVSATSIVTVTLYFNRPTGETQSRLLYFHTPPCTVTLTAGVGGAVSGGGTYQSGTSVTISATPNAHYHFTQWSDGNTSASRTFTVTENVELTAYFAIDTYSVSLTAGEGGTVSGGGSYGYGTQATIVATPGSGYGFKQWSDGSTDATRTVTVTNNLALHATFLLLEGSKKISDYAFKGCSSLTSISLNGVTSIGIEAFYGTGLTSVVIPDSTASIGTSAFRNCAVLLTVSVPIDVNIAGVFDKIPTSITLTYGTTGVGQGYDPNADLPWDRGSPAVTVTLGSGIISIGDNMFNGATALSSVSLPESLVSIGVGAFAGSGLTSIDLPSGVTSLSANAFNGCTSLAYVSGLDSVTIIGESCFSGCTSLASFSQNADTVLPASVSTLGNGAFYGCGFSSLTITNENVVLGTGVFIGTPVATLSIPVGLNVDGQFSDTVRTLTLTGYSTPAEYGPSSVLPWKNSESASCNVTITGGSVGAYTFYKCHLASLIASGLQNIGKSAFEGNTAQAFDDIPYDSLRIIGERAFAECTSMPSGIKIINAGIIGDEAFMGCTSLASVKMNASGATSWGNRLFYGSGVRDITLGDYRNVWISSSGDDGTFAIGLETDQTVTDVNLYSNPVWTSRYIYDCTHTHFIHLESDDFVIVAHYATYSSEDRMILSDLPNEDPRKPVKQDGKYKFPTGYDIFSYLGDEGKIPAYKLNGWRVYRGADPLTVGETDTLFETTGVAPGSYHLVPEYAYSYTYSFSPLPQSAADWNAGHPNEPLALNRANIPAGAIQGIYSPGLVYYEGIEQYEQESDMPMPSIGLLPAAGDQVPTLERFIFTGWDIRGSEFPYVAGDNMTAVLPKGDENDTVDVMTSFPVLATWNSFGRDMIFKYCGDNGTDLVVALTIDSAVGQTAVKVGEVWKYSSITLADLFNSPTYWTQRGYWLEGYGTVMLSTSDGYGITKDSGGIFRELTDVEETGDAIELYPAYTFRIKASMQNSTVYYNGVGKFPTLNIVYAATQGRWALLNGDVINYVGTTDDYSKFGTGDVELSDGTTVSVSEGDWVNLDSQDLTRGAYLYQSGAWTKISNTLSPRIYGVTVSDTTFTDTNRDGEATLQFGYYWPGVNAEHPNVTENMATFIIPEQCNLVPSATYDGGVRLTLMNWTRELDANRVIQVWPKPSEDQNIEYDPTISMDFAPASIFAAWDYSWEYILMYDPNGGEFESDTYGEYENGIWIPTQFTLKDYTRDRSIEYIVPTTVPSKEGYAFVGWSFIRNGEAIIFPGNLAELSAGNIGEDGRIHLYALWRKINEGLTVTLSYSNPHNSIGTLVFEDVTRIRQVIKPSVQVMKTIIAGSQNNILTDLGTKKYFEISFSRVSPDNPSDDSVDSRDWSNGKFIEQFYKFFDHWQNLYNYTNDGMNMEGGFKLKLDTPMQTKGVYPEYWGNVFLTGSVACNYDGPHKISGSMTLVRSSMYMSSGNDYKPIRIIVENGKNTDWGGSPKYYTVPKQRGDWFVPYILKADGDTPETGNTFNDPSEGQVQRGVQILNKNNEIIGTCSTYDYATVKQLTDWQSDISWRDPGSSEETIRPTVRMRTYYSKYTYMSAQWSENGTADIAIPNPQSLESLEIVITGGGGAGAGGYVRESGSYLDGLPEKVRRWYSGGGGGAGELLYFKADPELLLGLNSNSRIAVTLGKGGVGLGRGYFDLESPHIHVSRALDDSDYWKTRDHPAVRDWVEKGDGSDTTFELKSGETTLVSGTAKGGYSALPISMLYVDNSDDGSYSFGGAQSLSADPGTMYNGTYVRHIDGQGVFIRIPGGRGGHGAGGLVKIPGPGNTISAEQQWDTEDDEAEAVATWSGAPGSANVNGPEIVKAVYRRRSGIAGWVLGDAQTDDRREYYSAGGGGASSISITWGGTDLTSKGADGQQAIKNDTGRNGNGGFNGGGGGGAIGNFSGGNGGGGIIFVRVKYRGGA